MRIRNEPAAMLYVAWRRKEIGMDLSLSKVTSLSAKMASVTVFEDEGDDS